VRICLVSPEHSPWGGIGRSRRRLAGLLAARHEVTLIHSGGETAAEAGAPPPVPGVRELFVELDDELNNMVFASDDHRRSAAVLRLMEDAYGSAGPDYVEVCDYRAHGLVPLQARHSAHPLFDDTLFAVQLAGSAEVVGVHDATLGRPGMRLVADLECEQFRLADRIVWRGGDTLAAYRRHYPFPLPEGVLVRAPYEIRPAAPTPQRRDTEAPLRILCVGRLRRFKGVLDLVEACLRLPRDDWTLTLIGADTETAPMGRSVRMTIEAMCGEDPRVRIEDPISHEELQHRWTEHDLLAIPSTFEAWSDVALEAMRAGLPILATPVGGPAEIVEDGVTGWQADGVESAAIGPALTRLLENREELEDVRASGAVYERFLHLADPEAILESYDRLLSSKPPRPTPKPAPAAGDPLVTAVIPHHRTSPYIEETAGSFFAQTYPNLEAVIVNDGSFEQGDEVLDRLAADPRVTVVTQLNRGESAARNLGACLARGEYLMMLDADNMLEPEFVARAVTALRRDPELAYVTCWLRLILPDGVEQVEPSTYAPLGNSVLADDSVNWDGDTLAVLPRRLFSELGYRYEPVTGMQSDWELYRWLRDDGRFGAVIPDLLARYRIRPESLTRSYEEGVHDWSWEEARARRKMRATRWTAEA
jgi:glycogen synthase